MHYDNNNKNKNNNKQYVTMVKCWQTARKSGRQPSEVVKRPQPDCLQAGPQAGVLPCQTDSVRAVLMPLSSGSCHASQIPCLTGSVEASLAAPELSGTNFMPDAASRLEPDRTEMNLFFDLAELCVAAQAVQADFCSQGLWCQ